MSSLLQKLHEVAKIVDHMEKGGTNDHHGYSYVKADDVIRSIREELLSRDIVVIPSARNVEHFAQTGGSQFVTTVSLEYRFLSIGSGDNLGVEEEVVQWVGAGADKGGDKGLYKAYTGGLKYALLNLFMIPTGDDPERDSVTERGDAAKAHKDDDRPGAPVIPLDRAKAILLGTRDAGHATVTLTEAGEVTGATIAPTAKAKLASIGVDTGKIADLNVDQAEDYEAWLASEVKS